MLCTISETAIHFSSVQVTLWSVLSFSIDCAGNLEWLIQVSYLIQVKTNDLNPTLETKGKQP